MDIDTSDVREPDEEPPDFGSWEEPETLLTDHPIRERMLDVMFQVREPTPVAAIADRVDCDTETARDYLEWLSDAGIVREHSGRPVRYELNRSYLRWRRIERIRVDYTDAEIVAELETALATLEDYREQFGVTQPDSVSLLEVADADDVADVWETLSEWKTVEKRAKLLDAARRDDPTASGTPSHVDA